MSQSFDDYVQELRSGTPMEPTPPPGPKTPKTPKRPPKTASSGKPPQTARSMRQTNLISADMTIEPPLAMTARQLSNQSRQSRQSRGLPPAGRNSGLPDPTSISASPLAARERSCTIQTQVGKVRVATRLRDNTRHCEFHHHALRRQRGTGEAVRADWDAWPALCYTPREEE